MMLTAQTEDGLTLHALCEGASSEEMKAVLATAMKIAAESKLAGAPAIDTPVEELCDTAGFAVEEAEAMQGLATGQTTVTEALDLAGRAGVAVACHTCTRVLQSAIAAVPVVGPILSVFSGVLFTHMRTPQFTESVYTAVRRTASSVWEGIRERASGIKDRIASKVASWLFSS